MNQTPISVDDDMRATAYALGELPDEEIASADARFREDHAFRTAVEAVRRMAERIRAVLATEPGPDFRQKSGVPAADRRSHGAANLFRSTLVLAAALAGVNALIS